MDAPPGKTGPAGRCRTSAARRSNRFRFAHAAPHVRGNLPPAFVRSAPPRAAHLGEAPPPLAVALHVLDRRSRDRNDSNLPDRGWSIRPGGGIVGRVRRRSDDSTAAGIANRAVGPLRNVTSDSQCAFTAAAERRLCLRRDNRPRPTRSQDRPTRAMPLPAGSSSTSYTPFARRRRAAPERRGPTRCRAPD